MIEYKALSMDEYRSIEQLDCKHSHPVLLVKPKHIELEKLKRQYFFNCIPNGNSDSFGTGFYKFIKIDKSVGKTGYAIYHADAHYKAAMEEEFNLDFIVRMYLNPLATFKSVGRKDDTLDSLLGCTIEVIAAHFGSPDTKDKKPGRLSYSWRIIHRPGQLGQQIIPAGDDKKTLKDIYGY